MAAAAASSLTITKPDDFHLHVRDGPALKAVVPLSAQVFKRAVIMPNLRPPVVTAKQVSTSLAVMQAARQDLP